MPVLWPKDQWQTNTLVKWASQRLGGIDFGLCQAIGVHHGDELVAVAVYNGLRLPNIEITFVTASPKWASPNAVRALISYPFKQLGVKRLTAVTEATNQPARAFLCRLGFVQEGVHPDALPTGDAITYGLLRKSAAKWLGETVVGQEYTIGTCGS